MNPDPFGRAWTDAAQETDPIGAALAVLQRAVERCFDEDVRGADLDGALAFLGGRGDRTSVFTREFRRALALENPEDRQTELTQVLVRIRERFGDVGAA